MQSSSVNTANIGIISVPSNLQGQVSLRVLKKDGQDLFFLKGPSDVAEIRGSVQGKALKGPSGHPLQSLFLFYDDAMREALDNGETIEATLFVNPGFSNALLNFVEKYKRHFTETERHLKEGSNQSFQKISDIQKKIDQERDKFHKKSSAFQKAYIASQMQEQFQKDLLKQMFDSH